MAFTEKSEVKEITIIPGESTVQVKWLNTVEKDGEVLAAKEHYKLYDFEKKSHLQSDLGTVYDTYATVFDTVLPDTKKKA